MQTLRVSYQEPVCNIQLYRPEANNTLNDGMMRECAQILQECEQNPKISIVVLEGLPEVFCFGADFQAMHKQGMADTPTPHDPELTWNVWRQLQQGAFISVAHVRGKVNAGGVGFVAACDIVLADETAVFSLSEMLFGCFPALVLPFLIRRIGEQKAHYLTLMTSPVDVHKMLEWGLVDALEADSAELLRKHLLRLRCLSKKSVKRYKAYLQDLDKTMEEQKEVALEANREIFSDPDNLQGIFRYVERGIFPWQEVHDR